MKRVFRLDIGNIPPTEVVEENGAAEFVPDLGINIGFSF